MRKCVIESENLGAEQTNYIVISAEFPPTPRGAIEYARLSSHDIQSHDCHKSRASISIIYRAAY